MTQLVKARPRLERGGGGGGLYLNCKLKISGLVPRTGAY